MSQRYEEWKKQQQEKDLNENPLKKIELQQKKVFKRIVLFEDVDHEAINREREIRRSQFQARWSKDLEKIEETFLEMCRKDKGATKIVIPIADLSCQEHFFNYHHYYPDAYSPDDPGEEDLQHCYLVASHWFEEPKNKEKIAQVLDLPPEKYVYTKVREKHITILIKPYRKILNVKIECKFLDNSVVLRAVHDVPNGSAINVEEKNLADALEALAKQIRNTNIKRFDKVWGSDRIK